MKYPKITNSNLYWGIRNFVELTKRRINVTSSTCIRLKDHNLDWLQYRRTYGDEIFTLRVCHDGGCTLSEDHVNTIFKIMRTHRSYTLTIDWNMPIDKYLSVLENPSDPQKVSTTTYEVGKKEFGIDNKITIYSHSPRREYIVDSISTNEHPEYFKFYCVSTVNVSNIDVGMSFIINMQSYTKIHQHCVNLINKYVVEALCEINAFHPINQDVKRAIAVIRRRGEWDD